MLNISYIKLTDIKPCDNNVKAHKTYDIEQIVLSIKKYGFNDPIGVWGKENIIVEGHGRYEDARRIMLDEVPVIRLDGLTDEQRREYAIIHNKTTELSTWDMDTLKKELDELNLDDFDIDFGVKEKAKKERPEVEFTEYLNEENNYIVLQFKTDIDWLNAISVFGIDSKQDYSNRNDGKIKTPRIGTGRVLDGARALQNLLGVEQ